MSAAIAAKKLAARTTDELIADYIAAYALYNAEFELIRTYQKPKSEDRRPEMAVAIGWIEGELGRRAELGDMTAEEVDALIEEVAA